MSMKTEVKEITPEDKRKTTTFDIIEGKIKIEIETYFGDYDNDRKRVRIVLKNSNGYAGSIFFTETRAHNLNITITEGIITGVNKFKIWSHAPDLIAEKDTVGEEIIVRKAKNWRR